MRSRNSVIPIAISLGLVNAPKQNLPSKRALDLDKTDIACDVLTEFQDSKRFLID